MYEDYLAHWGILGMHWGIRRFQPYSVRGRKSGKGGVEIGDAKRNSPRHSASSARKVAKQRAAALEKARQAKAAKKEYETNKENALAKGSAKEVLKFKGDLTNKQLQDAVTRLGYEKKLKEIADSEVKTAWDKYDKVFNKVGKITDYADKSTKAWNIFAKAINAFSDEELPIIGENKKNDSDKAKPTKEEPKSKSSKKDSSKKSGEDKSKSSSSAKTDKTKSAKKSEKKDYWAPSASDISGTRGKESYKERERSAYEWFRKHSDNPIYDASWSSVDPKTAESAYYLALNAWNGKLLKP